MIDMSPQRRYERPRAFCLGGRGVERLGYPIADPIIGILITIAILVVLRTATRDVFGRLMDGVDPELVSAAKTCCPVSLGLRTSAAKMRWIGHRLHADVELDVNSRLSLAEAHLIAHGAQAGLTSGVPRLTTALVHAYPAHEPDMRIAY